MLNLNEYRFIREVKDSSPFTEPLKIQEYIDGVRFRLSQWVGVSEDNISDEAVYLLLKEQVDKKKQ